MKKILIAIVVLLVLFAVAILFVGRTFYPDNIAETSKDGGTKNLKTRVYEKDIAQVKNAVKEIIPTLSTYGGEWKIVERAAGSGTAKEVISVEVPVVVFTDDLEVSLEETDAGKVRVDVRSQSRVGKSDFGENARHVRKLLAALDQKLQ